MSSYILQANSSKKQPSQFSASTTFKMTSAPIGKSSIRLIPHYVTLNNLVNHVWLRLVKTLNKLSFHLLREDGLGGLRDCQDGKNLAAIRQFYETPSTHLFYSKHTAVLLVFIFVKIRTSFVILHFQLDMLFQVDVVVMGNRKDVHQKLLKVFGEIPAWRTIQVQDSHLFDDAV